MGLDEFLTYTLKELVEMINIRTNNQIEIIKSNTQINGPLNWIANNGKYSDIEKLVNQVNSIGNYQKTNNDCNDDIEDLSHLDHLEGIFNAR